MPQGTCSIAGCGTTGLMVAGWCTKHYQRWRKHGDVMWEPPAPRVGCTAHGCPLPHWSAGLCQNHYMKRRRTGTVDGRPRVAKTLGTCSVDGCDSVEYRACFCTTHHARWKRHGDPAVLMRERNRNPPATCQEPRCTEVHFARGLCQHHYSQANYQLNIDDRRAAMRRHYEADPEYYATKSIQRSRQIGSIPAEDRVVSTCYRKAIAKDRCHYCDAPGEHNEHYFPLSKGGMDYWFNLVRSCSACNWSKAAHCGTWFILKGRTGAATDGFAAVVAEAG